MCVQARKQNPRAFVFSSRGKAKIQQARTAEKEQRRMHVPMVERPAEEPPPYIILVHGPPGVGKTTLIKGLIKHYTRQDVNDPRGPVTLVAGKARRLSFIECPQDLGSMMDAAKFADLVLLLIDGSFGFEMETFEFLNILQVHGFPKVMGVLTHLDGFTDVKALKKTKKALKHRFWTEIYQGAKLFYLSGIKHGKYLKREVHNLARFISVMKFRPLQWRQAHPYLLADRLEDVTPPGALKDNPKADRDVTLYGYVRGANWRQGAKVHIAGVGDFPVSEIVSLPDPCPLPSQLKKRSLNERERLIYAPMSDVGSLLYDKDAMYIDIPDWKVQFSSPGAAAQGVIPGSIAEGEAMVRELHATKLGMDEKLEAARIKLFAGGQDLTGADVTSARETASMSDEEPTGDDNESDSSDEESLMSSSDEEDEDEDENQAVVGQPVEELVSAGGGRVRRRAIFPEAGVALLSGLSDSDKEEEEEEEEEEEDEEEKGEAQDNEDLSNIAPWKAAMFERAAALFSTRAADLQNFVYGTRAIADGSKLQKIYEESEDAEDEGELFKIKKHGDRNDEENGTALDVMNALDSSRSFVPAVSLELWAEEGAAEKLRNRFVTGDWGQGNARAAARPAAEEGSDEEEDNEVFGDFEDLETGVKYAGSADPATRAAVAAIAATEAEEIAEKKLAKKAAFDSEYDEGGGAKAMGMSQKKKEKGKEDDDEEEGETYYDAMKKEMSERVAKTKAAMDALNPNQRVIMEGHRPGVYVRVRFNGLPCEMIENYDPRTPILVGGLGQGEEAMGMMQVRLKRHRWFPKVLKNRDPLIFSIGWRRFQSLPVYAIEDNNGRHRMLKYSPEHMHCLAAVWGPLAPPSTGVLCVQKLDSQSAHWRIAATGVVLQLDASLKIVKKLKLVGTPAKIHRHTAFIQGMFNSQLEAAKFEGAGIRTVSGIRGTIKKALRAGEGLRDGSYRATFEDKPLLSDIVFLRAWVQVDIPKFSTIVATLLAPTAEVHKRQAKPHKKETEVEINELYDDDAEIDFHPAFKFMGARKGFVFKAGSQGLGYYEDIGMLNKRLLKKKHAKEMIDPSSSERDADKGPSSFSEKAGWLGVRTTAELRREAGIGAPRESDSLYRPINRGPRKFNPLKVPTSLQALLPFKSKPKLESKRRKPTLEQRRAVVLEPAERRKVTLLQQLNAIRNKKAELRRAQRERSKVKLGKRQEAEEAWRTVHNKEERKKKYVEKGQAVKRAEKRTKYS